MNDSPLPLSNSDVNVHTPSPEQSKQSSYGRYQISTLLKAALQQAEVKPDEPVKSRQDIALKNATQQNDAFVEYKKNIVNSWTLTFNDRDVEDAFLQVFVMHTIKVSRITMFLTVLACIFFFGLAIGFNPMDSVKYESTYKYKDISIQQMRDNPSLCPKGWYCQECPNYFLCANYEVYKDALFFTSGLIVGLGCIAFSFLGRKIRLEYQCWNSWFFLVFYGVVLVIGRHNIQDTGDTYMMSSVFTILLVTVVMNGLSLRAVQAGSATLILVVSWIVSAIILNENKDQNKKRQIYALAIGLFFSGISATLHQIQIEIAFRDQFLRSQVSAKTNLKLTNQLKALQRSYAAGTVDLETPLEKALSLLRSMMADPNIQQSQYHSFELVMQYLNSPQLFNPDFESQFALIPDATTKQVNRVDTDQRTWLVTETMRRLNDTPARNRSMSGKQRRGSLFAETVRQPESLDSLPPVPMSIQLQAASSVAIAAPAAVIVPRMAQSGSFVIPSQETSPNVFSQSALPTMNDDPFSFATSQLLVIQSQSVHEVEQLAASPMLDISANITQIPSPKPLKRSPKYHINSIQNYLAQVTQWNWQLFDFAEACPGNKPLYLLCWHLFDINSLFEEFNISLDKFNKFVWAIQEGYRDLPYHNSFHAADVLHAVNYFTQFEQVQSIMSPMELMAMYIAAAIHDFDHPGVNNSFLCATSNPLAIMYNDKAVLENYHLSASFQLLLKPANFFLQKLSKPEYRQFRELVIELVLATDLSQHYSILTQFKTRLQNTFNPIDSRDDRILLYKMLIKCSDVSNPTKDFGIYMKWTNLVIDEWQIQGDQEKKLDIPVSPFMDRDNPNVLISSQNGFIDFIIVPMYDSLNSGYMKMPLPMQQLESNKQHFLKLKEQSQTQTQTQAKETPAQPSPPSQ